MRDAMKQHGEANAAQTAAAAARRTDGLWRHTGGINA
jgi:hypothetical protein